MATKDTALTKFVSACDAQASFRERNADVFKEHDRLGMNVVDAETELRDAVAESDSGVSGAGYEVTRTEQTQTVYNEDAILAKLGLTKEQAIEQGLITVNKRPPRITISRPRAS